MSIKLLADRYEDTVADLCHNQHPQLDKKDHDHVQYNGDSNQFCQSGKIAGGNMFVDRVFHDQRVYETDKHAERHDRQNSEDLFFIVQQIGKQAHQRLHFTDVCAVFVLLIRINSHNLSPPSGQASCQTEPARFDSKAREGQAVLRGYHVLQCVRFPGR